MRKSFRNLMLIGLLIFATPLMVKAEIVIKETVYRYGKVSAKAYVIENDYYQATLVPEMGGRILKLLDKKSNINLVYDKGYGGLLDDHGGRFKKAYTIKWLKRSPEKVVVQLAISEAVCYSKTIVFYASRPVMKVSYNVDNLSQEVLRLLFRNVVRPGGTSFQGHEVYSYSLQSGLKQAKGMPRVDNPADPWCALTDAVRQETIAAVFEGDAIERLYTWQGSDIAPTFEFMFKNLQAGHSVDFSYYWLFCHGFKKIDYACRDMAVSLDGNYDGTTVKLQTKVNATWAKLDNLMVSGVILDSDRKQLGIIPNIKLSSVAIDEIVSKNFEIKVKSNPYVIILMTFKSPTFQQSYTLEKVFPLNNNTALMKNYRKPVRRIGDKNIYKLIPGWKKKIKYEVKASSADKKRSYMIFAESGPNAGKHVSELKFELGLNEQESFPLHMKSFTYSGNVKITAKTSPGISLEIFDTRKMPETIWGKVYYGLKLILAQSFSIKKDEDKVIYFRIRSNKPPIGKSYFELKFEPENKKASLVKVNLEIFPVLIPEQPKMVFDVNNLVNYLCSKINKKQQLEWSPDKADNYLRDMMEHGVRGQNIAGKNSPSSHYFYDKIKLKNSGIGLLNAIKKNRDIFKGRVELPSLDFSYWDFLVERMLHFRQTHLRWPASNCGPSFFKQHMKLTKLIYGRTFEDGDIRQQIIQEWYIRELVRYFKDRGIPQIMVTIDDEIPSEKLAWWVMHAYRMKKCGLMTGVTQSAQTISDDKLINMIAPFMDYWIISTLHKPTLDLRRKQNIIKPEHWLTTYNSTANHWKEYSSMRGYCGLRSAYFGLDACWIQTYFRRRQSEAVIYPGKNGPYDSAAWEGARDGLDDANYYLLAKSMIQGLPKNKRNAYSLELEKIVGGKHNSLIKLTEKKSDTGMITAIGYWEDNFFIKPSGGQLREAKRSLLKLIVKLNHELPVQNAAANFGNYALIRNGKSVFKLPAKMKYQDYALNFLKKAAGKLHYTAPQPENITKSCSVFFFGTPDELKKIFPKLAAHKELKDIGTKYPQKGNYVIRFIQEASKADSSKQVVSLLIICRDQAGAEKALELLPRVVTQPDKLYSHFLIYNQQRKKY